MNVRDLFQLERSVHRDRIMNGAAQKHEVLDSVIALRQLFALIGRSQNRFDLLRQRQQFSDVALRQSARGFLFQLAQMQRKHKQACNLRCEGLS